MKFDKVKEEESKNINSKDLNKLKVKRTVGKILKKFGEASGFVVKAIIIIALIKILGTSSAVSLSIIMLIAVMLGAVLQIIANYMINDNINPKHMFCRI